MYLIRLTKSYQWLMYIFDLKKVIPKDGLIAATDGVRQSIIYTCTLGGLQMWQMKCNTFWVQIESCKMNVCHF